MEFRIVGSYRCMSALSLLALYAMLDLCQFLCLDLLFVLTAWRGVAIGRGWDELTGLADQFVTTALYIG